MDDSTLSCPDCGHLMTKMSDKIGEYYACTNHHACKAVLNLNDAKVRMAEILAGIKPAAIKRQNVDTQVGGDALCPVCDEPMELSYSNKSNSKLYICTDFPRCRGTRDA